MQLDLQPVRAMIARLVEHHVSIRHEEQPVIALEKEAGRVAQVFLPEHRRDPSHGQKQRFNHDGPPRGLTASAESSCRHHFCVARLATQSACRAANALARASTSFRPWSRILFYLNR
jgi:hypothetical protein